MTLSQKFDDALAYASQIHRLQKRKSTEIPYLGHLLGVASIALDHGATEDQAIAALLHDAAEDQGGQARLDDIRTRFGDAVAHIVGACSDSLVEDGPKESWPVRKRAYLRHLGDNTSTVLLVSVCDKLHNLRSMLSDYGDVGEELWKRFNPAAGKIGSIRYYRSLVAAYRRSDDRRVLRVANELAATLARLEHACGASETELADGLGLLGESATSAIAS